MGQGLVNRATNQKLYANNFQKVGCSGEWRENSDSSDLRPKGAEYRSNTGVTSKKSAASNTGVGNSLFRQIH